MWLSQQTTPRIGPRIVLYSRNSCHRPLSYLCERFRSFLMDTVKMSLHIEPETIAGLPPDGPFIFVWGTGAYRKSGAYLSVVPAAQFESGKGTRHFAGLDRVSAPIWSEKESDARAVVQTGTVGDLSVTWCKDLGLWLMTYDSREPAPRGILFSYSQTPWGPWSDPQIIFNAARDGALGKFIHNPQANPDDGLSGPAIGKGQTNLQAAHGGANAPYVIERWTRVKGSELSIYYAMSAWNPYVVALMKSQLHVQQRVTTQQPAQYRKSA